MLPLTQKLLFAFFAVVMGALGLRGFYRLYRRIARGRSDTDARLNHLPRRIAFALTTTLTQSRTFRKRPWVSFFHSFIFYGFTFYLLVNLVDAVDGYVPLSFQSLGLAGNLYVLLADVLSALVLVGVIALIMRRFLLPSRRDFSFNERTLLHKNVQRKYITADSIIVSTFILFHVGSRAIGAGAKLAIDGPDHFAPFATLLSHLSNAQNAVAWRIFGYWGALGSVLALLAYFPYSKHIHIFMAPAKYVVMRDVPSGMLPAMALDMEAEEPKLGAKNIEDLAWPRLLDAYACIQCNRCQDVCPATATGKSLSPSALEINKRMELNELSRHQPSFETGAPSPHPLLSFALSPEAAWACTTCGACIDVCPVGDEPMLDIIDIRREQVMLEGEFPTQLQTAFRGMERAKNPWGINHEKRMDWAEGLQVKTTDENPEPDVLFWVGCAASYDPQSQKTARAFVQLLDHAGINFAVLGKRECCTGDTARRAGNEYLYRQLADQNVATLNEIKPKLIVATCPHCMNSIGKEYTQIGGDYKVMHHTQYLETLVADGRLAADFGTATVAYHDPCYLGRHNGVYDAPRNVLKVLNNAVVELPRNRENAFCCGAGGAQFWKEEEPGSERIAGNRLREVERTLDGAQEKVLAVGCPFCKSMLGSTPSEEPVTIKDVAELLLEGVQRRSPETFAARKMAVSPQSQPGAMAVVAELPVPAMMQSHPASAPQMPAVGFPEPAASTEITATKRKSWTPKHASSKEASFENVADVQLPVADPAPLPAPNSATSPVDEPKTPARKAWTPKARAAVSNASAPVPVAPEETSPATVAEAAASSDPTPAITEPGAPVRKVWAPKTVAAKPQASAPEPPAAAEESSEAALPATSDPRAPVRKIWVPKAAKKDEDQ